MEIQLITDHNICMSKKQINWAKEVVKSALGRAEDRITQVEIHVSDANSDKKSGSNTMHCMIEARLNGRQPMAVSDQRETLTESVNGAADKLSRMLETILGRQRDQRRHRTDPLLPQSESLEGHEGTLM